MVSRRRKTLALVAALACVVAACAPSKYEFAANKKLGVYLKVPNGWTELAQDDLFPLYAQGDKQPSEEGFQILKQVLWERAWDSSPKPGVNNLVLGQADAPVARVSVRALTADQQRTISPASVRTLALGAYNENLEEFTELLRNPGTADLVSADFIPLRDDDLKPNGYFGTRQLFEARTASDETLYMIGFIGLVDNARTRIYSLTVHCNLRCYKAHKNDIDKVLDSFTVRKP